MLGVDDTVFVATEVAVDAAAADAEEFAAGAVAADQSGVAEAAHEAAVAVASVQKRLPALVAHQLGYARI